jgi:hypothetical protein
MDSFKHLMPKHIHIKVNDNNAQRCVLAGVTKVSMIASVSTPIQTY